jgi:hypothetical protein
MIVTFLYRMGDGPRKYGKYIGYLSDDYEEGMDKELEGIMWPLLGLPGSREDFHIGILFHSRVGSDYFSEDEKLVFDVLYCNWSNQAVELFIDGKRK